MRQRTLAILAAAALLLLALRHPLELRLLAHRAAPRPDVRAEPAQVPRGRAPFDFLAGGRRYRLTPRFAWDQSARVVGDRAYRFGAAAALIPEDLALVWGPVLSPPFAGRISYSQYSRFFFWHTKDAALDRGTIVSHAANVHVIPKSPRLRTAVRCISEGDDVRLEGWLVDVDGVTRPGVPLGHEHVARGRGARAPARPSTSSG